MADPDLPELTGEQKGWAFAGAGLFLLAIGFLGFALSNGIMVAFAIGWVALQIFGYVGSLKRANGDFAHPLFKSQVMLHAVAVGLLVMVLFGGRA
ncbi:MAG: pyridoxal phosphate biosynthetic protein [Pseudomonadota bacterium]